VACHRPIISALRVHYAGVNASAVQTTAARAQRQDRSPADMPVVRRLHANANLLFRGFSILDSISGSKVRALLGRRQQASSRLRGRKGDFGCGPVVDPREAFSNLIFLQQLDGTTIKVAISNIYNGFINSV
jgi:hypothetical protein